MQAGFDIVVLARQAQVAGKGAFVVYCGLAVAVASGLPGDGAVAGERPLGLPALVVEVVVNLRALSTVRVNSGSVDQRS